MHTETHIAAAGPLDTAALLAHPPTPPPCEAELSLPCNPLSIVQGGGQ